MPRVFLTDFGLAKNSLTGSKLTRSGTALGTPQYMSPEQARGDAHGLTAAADVWALGCVLQECLTGVPVFDGDTPAAVIGAVLTGQASPLGIAPTPVRRLVAACLQGDASGRPRDAGALRGECDRVLRGRMPATRSISPTIGWAVGLAGVVLTVATAWGVATRWTDAPPPAAPADPASGAAARTAATGWELRAADPAQAIALLSEALQSEPRHHLWRLQLGLLRWSHEGDPRASIDLWSAVPADAPERARAQWLVGLAWMSERLVQDAPELAAPARAAWALAAAAEGAAARWGRAGVCYADGEYASARELLEGEDDWSTALLLGLVETDLADSAAGTPDLARGVAAYRSALERGLPLAWAYVNLGVLYGREGDQRAAEAAHTRAIQLRPDLAAAYANRAVARRKAGDLAGALSDYDRALELRPAYVLAWFNRALLHEKAGRLPQALADYTHALSLKPGSGKGHFHRGGVRAALGDVDGALADYRAAIANRADYAAPHGEAGRLLATRGEWEAALTHFREYLAIEPEGPRADHVRQLVALCRRKLGLPASGPR